MSPTIKKSSVILIATSCHLPQVSISATMSFMSHLTSGESKVVRILVRLVFKDGRFGQVQLFSHGSQSQQMVVYSIAKNGLDIKNVTLYLQIGYSQCHNKLICQFIHRLGFKHRLLASSLTYTVISLLTYLN